MIRHLCAASLLLPIVACSGDLSGPRSEAGLVLEASLSSPSIEEEAADTLTVTLTNTNPVPITLHFGSGCQIVPYVTNMIGDILVPKGGSPVCLTVLSSRTLEPHEVQTATFVWSGSTDFSPAVLPRVLPNGVYHVFAELDAYEVQLRTDHLAVQLK